MAQPAGAHERLEDGPELEVPAKKEAPMPTCRDNARRRRVRRRRNESTQLQELMRRLELCVDHHRKLYAGLELRSGALAFARQMQSAADGINAAVERMKIANRSLNK